MSARRVPHRFRRLCRTWRRPRRIWRGFRAATEHRCPHGVLFFLPERLDYPICMHDECIPF